MNIASKKEPLVLLLGDVVCFVVSLWLALFLRSLSVPSEALFFTHLVPFGLLIVAWVVIFYIAGLYERHTILLKTKLPGILFNTQVANAIVGVIFFYLIPLFGITPKTVLFIYLVISFLLISLWRMYGYLRIGSNRKEKAVIIGSGREAEELREEINNNDIYNVRIVPKTEDPSVVIVDFSDERVEPLLADLYDLIFTGVNFMDMHEIYEDIFKRVPLSIIRYNWFLENVSTVTGVGYGVLKRAMDIALASILGLFSLIVYPFVILAIKLEDGGSAFIAQERVGENDRLIRIYKFRSMTGSDEGKYGEGGATVLKVTKVGKFLRNSRVDELPQLWSVIKGDQSLIGPRPELPSLVTLYKKEIPYYHVRHLVKPGLSGWAQIYQEKDHPHHENAVEQTREKLAYDLYYVKNRSLMLDLKIALRTVKTLFSRVGK
ncbi:sugar transferase [Candidatus Parcubacteria bacterium]|nr:sugar transferase [Candidatus Parcubacteria bacterium]